MSDDLFDALKSLNNAAYAASRAGRDTARYPQLDRETLRRICTETDRLVDDHQPPGQAPARWAMGV